MQKTYIILLLLFQSSLCFGQNKYVYIQDHKEWRIDTSAGNTGYSISYLCAFDSAIVSEDTIINLKNGVNEVSCYHNYFIRINAGDIDKNLPMDSIRIDKSTFLKYFEDKDFVKKSILTPPEILLVRPDHLKLHLLLGHPRSDYLVEINFTVRRNGEIVIDEIR